MVVANRDFQDLEFGNPYQLFQQQGYEIDIASGLGGEAFGVFGRKIATTLKFDEVDVNNYDALVFVGGGGAYAEYLNDEKYLELGKQAKLLCAICIAPTLLAPSGRFEGKEVTGRDDGKGTEIRILEASGAKFREQPVVQDGEIITANGPEASIAFGRKIIEALEGKTEKYLVT